VHSLLGLAYSVITAEPKAEELLQEHFFMLPMLRTDQPIFSENRTISVFLRLAQFRLVASKEEPKDTAACVDALLREAGGESDATLRSLLESIALGLVLNTIGIASSVPNWIELLQRSRTLTEANPILKELKKDTEKASKQIVIKI
jgi:hypothetical protein